MPAQLPLPYLPPHFPASLPLQEKPPLLISERMHRSPAHCMLRRHAQQPGKCNDRFSIFLRNLCNPDRRFSHSGLSVHTPFPGNHKISLCNFLLQACFFYYNLDTGFQLCIHKCKKCKSQTACRPPYPDT